MLTPNDGVEGMYLRACARGCRSRLWAALTRHPCQLLSLAALSDVVRPGSCASLGVQTVAIRQICGSEGRVGDFDRDFNPLMDHGQERWMRVAEAWRRGVTLPPVQLIRVGERYFVRDGHHRISVARSLGQREIEAEVVAWAVDGSLPWERPGTSRRRTGAGGDAVALRV